MNRLIVIAIVVLGLVLVGSTAQAGTCTFSETSGNNWTTGANWSCGQEPTAEDLAVIPDGTTCTMDDATGAADSLTVESNATLNVQANKKLSLNSSTANTTITGTVNLQGASSELAFIDNSQTIDGSGKIVGQDNGAQISIVEFKTLTSDTTIEDTLKITGDGDFLNHGTVHANVAGSLVIDCDSFDDDSTALWKVASNSSAILKIAVASTTAPDLAGAFEVFNGGTLNVTSKGFKTTGSLLFRNGWISVVSGSSVTFSE